MKEIWETELSSMFMLETPCLKNLGFDWWLETQDIKKLLQSCQTDVKSVKNQSFYFCKSQCYGT